MQSRRDFLKQMGLLATAGASLPLGESCLHVGDSAIRRPNIVLILADDQGYGDFSLTGNPQLKTPHIDALAREGITFTQFFVSPVCSPTRASLMTGRYNYRTCVIDTYRGHSMMDPAEVTLAEALKAGGYRTGIFGKWHLGDHAPLRAMDKGFDESLVLRGGGLMQPSDVPGNSYFDPILSHNGHLEKCYGYCMDVYTDAAIRFIDRNRDEPFFCYLATNTPHYPLLAPAKYVTPFRKMGLGDEAALTYGMVANIDANVGRLMKRLNELNLDEQTIVVYLSDNGPYMSPGNERFNGGLRGSKGSVYDGGIRMPCLMRRPGHIPPGTTADCFAAHIDLMPTLLEACHVPQPEGVRLDGHSLAPFLDGHGGPEPDPERNLFFQWHRGNAPVLYKNCCVRNLDWKLVDGVELYDLRNDPAERQNVAGAHPDVVARMRHDYETWFHDVCSTRGFDPVRNDIGSVAENPVELTREDWLDALGWEGVVDDAGWWAVRVRNHARYNVTLRFPPGQNPAGGEAHFRLGSVALDRALPQGSLECLFSEIEIPAGEGRLEAWFTAKGAPANLKNGALSVEVKRV